jgi:hypothetical protein
LATHALGDRGQPICARGNIQGEFGIVGGTTSSMGLIWNNE